MRTQSLIFIVASMTFIFVVGCKVDAYIVYPTSETTPVGSAMDAADDPAIFIHPTDPIKSVIIGTDKQKGLVIYDTKGAIVHEYAIGRINNVDIRQNVIWNEEQITVVGGSNRTDNSIVFYQLDAATRQLTPLHQTPILSKVDEVYGFCMYQAAVLYAFVVGKDGVVEQWKLLPAKDDGLDATLIRSFDVGSQCEGLVADDEFGYLYVGEEEVGIWKYNIKDWDGQKSKVQLIAENKNLKADIEGLTVYYGENGKGYLIASSQGNHTYAIYERQGDNNYLGSFKIEDTKAVDGTFDTDGIDVTAQAFGTEFPSGVFIAQDGANGKENQNFKLVDWTVLQQAIDAIKQ